ncbi:MAG TPA: dihydrodipicolinate reductase C-terminal domain-containing protein, partial [Gemmatimonas sp.]|nr:dihydrodipicolinate reductase C-terminal domain-containing protein [Gemmatimonas sp.]
CPVVVGTTGWSAQHAELEAAVVQFNCPALWSPNFSVGVQLFLSIVEDAARRFRGVHGFDVHIVETHHVAKLDAPSGTAMAIRQRAEDGLHRDVGVTSVRVGSVPGTHEVVFDGGFEQVRLVHEARDRRVFADGAISAARWLAKRPHPALYTMRDVIETPQGGSEHGAADGRAGVTRRE